MEKALAVTDQELIQNIINESLASNKPIVFPEGTFHGNWEINNIKGVSISGAGKLSTKLYGTDPTKPTLSIKGMWYSKLEDMMIGRAVVGPAALEVDRSTNFGVQGNHFQNLLIDGQGINDGIKSAYAMSMCRVGGNGAQGSEQVLINCHFSGADVACYYQSGFNALNNMFIGGNFQNYNRCGIELLAGSCHVINVGFQSVSGLRQVDRDGWDIACYYAGVSDTVLVMGCRSESIRFCRSAWSQPASIIGCSQRWAIPKWYPNVNYTVGYELWNGPNLYKCITDHNSGSTFDSTKWKSYSNNAIYMDNGRIQDCNLQGTTFQKTNLDNGYVEVNKSLTLAKNTKLVMADASNGPIEITLFSPYAEDSGHSVEIIKCDKTDNKVTILSNYLNNQPNHHKYELTTPFSGQKFYSIGGGRLTRRHYYKNS